MTKDALGAEYADYNLVVAGPLGMPTEQSTINGALKQLIEENDLPKVVFHSFRHSSITYKLKLNGGDIKAVQGDSGHAQASMVTEQYAHILDDDRRLNAQRFDDFFYQHHGAEPEVLPRAEQSAPKASPVDTDAAAALAKLLADPSMAALIKILQKTYKSLYISSGSFRIWKSAAVLFYDDFRFFVRFFALVFLYYSIFS